MRTAQPNEEKGLIMKQIGLMILGTLLACSLLSFAGCGKNDPANNEETGTKAPAGVITTVTEGDEETKKPATPEPPATTEQETDPDGGLWSPEV